MSSKASKSTKSSKFTKGCVGIISGGVLKVIKIPSRMFKGPRGPELAAITIQKNCRMYNAHTASS